MHIQRNPYSATAQRKVAFITRGEVIPVFKTEVVLSIYQMEDINTKEALIAKRIF